MAIYQERLMDHYRNSPYRGVLPEPSFAIGEQNPSCGDVIALTGIVRETVLERLAFEGAGCVISQAAASLLCQESRGKSLADLDGYGTTEIMAMIGIPLGPTRLKCALLPLDALRKGLAVYRAHNQKERDARSCKGDVRDSAGCS